MFLEQFKPFWPFGQNLPLVPNFLNNKHLTGTVLVNKEHLNFLNFGGMRGNVCRNILKPLSKVKSGFRGTVSEPNKPSLSHC